jgi:adenylate cyclase
MTKDPTHATAVAALEAERNEELTLAQGALLGERRAAIARLAMVVLFAFTVQVVPELEGRGQPFDPMRFAVGLGYTLFAIGHLIAVHRIRATPRGALIVPVITTLIDFAFIFFQGYMDIRTGDGTNPEMAAGASAILISFAMVRVHVALALLPVALAILSFTTLSQLDGTLTAESIVFVNCAFVALGLMFAMTNRAMRRMFKELRRRDNLTRFLPQPVAERMLSIGPEALAPVQRDVTVLFSDIRGFTSISETLEPRQVLGLLDEYFGRMAQIVKGHDGVVGKFLGDGLLAFWNVPDRDPDHAAKAVRAALDMLRALAELNRDRAADGWPTLRIGIGIHTGPVAAGMLGGPDQSEYTVIGDAVNVASRVEGLTKSLGAEVLVSETTWALCADRFGGRRLAAEEIRGRKEPVVLFALDGS